MAVTATLASLLLTLQPANAIRWQCSSSQGQGEAQVILTRTLDPDGQVLSESVTWKPDSFHGLNGVRWERLDRVALSPQARRLRADQVMVDLTLSRPARQPVWLVLRADGHIVARRLLFRQISELPDYMAQGLWILTGFGGRIARWGPMPELGDPAEVVVSAEEESGETLARISLPLPGQPMIQQAIARLTPALETAAADYRTRCTDLSRPSQTPATR